MTNPQEFVRNLANYKMMYFDGKEDPIIERAGEMIVDDEPKEASWDEEEGDRQDDNPNEN